MIKIKEINLLDPDFIIKLITLVSIAIYFTLNFKGSTSLKWVYPIFIILTIASIVLLDFKKSLLTLIVLSFVEGQGRILWSYHPVMRIIFDVSVLLTFLKALIIRRELFPIHKIPRIFSLAIIFHFLWFIVQIFNVKNVGYIGVISASKIYIFPFLVFFLFLLEPLNDNEEDMINIRRLIIILFILEGSLSIFQMGQGEQFLYKIHGYYKQATKGIFEGFAFRPFATSHLPGAMSTYFMLTIPFLFLFPSKKSLEKILVSFATVISLFALFIMQVRSSLIKEIIILLVIFFIGILNSNNRVKDLMKSAILVISLSIIFVILPSMEKMFPDIDFKMSTDRIMNLSSVDKISSQRASPSLFLSVMKDKLTDNPLGLGPGRTGAASGISSSKIKADPIYDMQYSWTHDNLYISLAIDLGFGMIFYLIIIVGLPLYLLYFGFFKEVTSKEFRIVVISSITPLILLIGNWGALGIPYNPESFYFWFWIAMGLNQLHDSNNIRKNEQMLN